REIGRRSIFKGNAEPRRRLGLGGRIGRTRLGTGHRRPGRPGIAAGKGKDRHSHNREPTPTCNPSHFDLPQFYPPATRPLMYECTFDPCSIRNGPEAPTPATPTRPVWTSRPSTPTFQNSPIGPGTSPGNWSKSPSRTPCVTGYTWEGIRPASVE